jgi:serine/threonine protein kinase
MTKDDYELADSSSDDDATTDSPSNRAKASGFFTHRLENYRVSEKRLGAGAYATVVKCTHKATSRECALKKDIETDSEGFKDMVWNVRNLNQPIADSLPDDNSLQRSNNRQSMLLLRRLSDGFASVTRRGSTATDDAASRRLSAKRASQASNAGVEKDTATGKDAANNGTDGTAKRRGNEETLLRDEILKFVGQADGTKFIVEILDYSSRNGTETPGLDPGRDSYWIVFESAELSLRDHLDQHKDPFSVEEIRWIFYALCGIVCALHVHNLCHLDLKPENVLRFPVTNGSANKQTGSWKLIDLDGVCQAGTSVEECVDRVAVTDMYICPELARFNLARSGKPVVRGDEDKASQANIANDLALLVSRKMDVWTIGLMGLELIFKQPVYEPFYERFVNDQKEDVDSFYQLMVDPTKLVIDAEMRKYVSNNTDSGFCALLEKMCQKDPSNRATIVTCLKDSFFDSLNAAGAFVGAPARRGSASRACVLQ